MVVWVIGSNPQASEESATPNASVRVDDAAGLGDCTLRHLRATLISGWAGWRLLSHSARGMTILESSRLPHSPHEPR